MVNAYLIFLGLITLACSISFITVYLIFKRGIAIYLIGAILEIIFSVGICCFTIGHEGIFSIWTLVAMVIVSPANVGMILFLFWKLILPLGKVGNSVKELVNTDLPALDYASKEIAGGNLGAHVVIGSQPLTIKSMGEVNDFINAYNEMVISLSKTGMTFDQMATGLRQLLGDVGQTAEMLNHASTHLAITADQTGRASSQIAASIQQVAQGINCQVESITATVTAMDQMGQSIHAVARGANDQSRALTEAVQITEEMRQVIQTVSSSARAGSADVTQAAETTRASARIVHDTIAGMEAIRLRVGLSVEKVTEMGSRSEEIGTIAEIIEDIAAQTNLLALNAAIEAARAGEHGKGFAVVADEVRKLAERAGSSTREITGQIKAIQNAVAGAVEAMGASAREVETGVQTAGQADRALADILTSVGRLAGQIKTIETSTSLANSASDRLGGAMRTLGLVTEVNTGATDEMANHSEKVSAAAESIASVSEENSAAVEEVNASAKEMAVQALEFHDAAQSMAQMAGKLREMLVRFTLDGAGKN